MKRAAIAILLVTTGMAYSTGPQAASLSGTQTWIKSADISIVRHARSKNGSIARSTGQLRTFRPNQIDRVRPTFAWQPVRPGRPLAQRSTTRPLNLDRKDQSAYRKRPRRLHYVNVAEGVTPEVPSAASRDERRDDSPMSPDFCRYWGDRGEVGPQWNLCW